MNQLLSTHSDCWLGAEVVELAGLDALDSAAISARMKETWTVPDLVDS